MRSKVVAPHKVMLVVRSRFSEPLCFEWGSKFGYLDDAGLRKLRRFPLLNPKSKGKLADDYVLVYQNKFGDMIRPPQVRIGRKWGEMTFRSRIFRVDEIQIVKK